MNLGMAAMGIAHLGQQFGFLNKEAANTIVTLGSVMSVAGALMRGIDALRHITSVATVVEWLHNASLAMKVSLMTAGVGLVIALGAYMAYLAVQTNNAAAATERLNTVMEDTYLVTGKNITRAQAEEFLRRGGE
jgi:hypothetical protein